jgi:hypothetical protein
MYRLLEGCCKVQVVGGLMGRARTAKVGKRGWAPHAVVFICS